MKTFLIEFVFYIPMHNFLCILCGAYWIFRSSSINVAFLLRISYEIPTLSCHSAGFHSYNAQLYGFRVLVRGGYECDFGQRRGRSSSVDFTVILLITLNTGLHAKSVHFHRQHVWVRMGLGYDFSIYISMFVIEHFNSIKFCQMPWLCVIFVITIYLSVMSYASAQHIFIVICLSIVCA